MIKLTTIEKMLGNYRRLPEYPFNNKGEIAVFPGLDDYLVDEALYRALYKANNLVGNKTFLAQASVGIKGENIPSIQQDGIDWKSFKEYQSLNLVYKGFYMTGENLNWLGIYHLDDYIVVGGNNDFVEIVCNELYGDSDWLSKFEEAYKSGRVAIYEEDFDYLYKSLFKPYT